MKITNDTEGAREYPTLAIILQPGESFDDTKPAKASAPIPAPSATDSTENEVK
jgi:hypothetical protein